MRRLVFQFVLFIVAVALALGARRAEAGPMLVSHDDHFHADFAAGDDHGDALTPPSDGPTANFVLQGGKWPQGGLGTPVTLTYSYNNLLDGGLLDPNGNPLPADFIRSSVEEAFGLWASVAPLHFVEVEDEGGPVQLSNYPDGQFGQIRLSHRFINGQDPPACFEPGADPGVCGASAKAQAYFPSGFGNLAGDVFYDHGDRWRVSGTLAEPDVLGATVHEVGHTLGLGHTSVSEANMYWVFQRSTGLGTASLHPDDIAGIRAVYGAGVGSVTPLVVIPEPTAWVLLAFALVSAACLRLRDVLQ